MDEDTELQLEALMRQRRVVDSRLNRALGELLGTGRGRGEALAAIAELEDLLRSIASVAASVPD